jgi:thioredoxin-related protein
MEETKMEEIKVEEVQSAEVCEKKSFCNFDNKKKIILGVILAVVIVGFIAFPYYKKTKQVTVGLDEIKAKIESLVADSGGKVTVGDVVLDGDLYKVTITASGKDQFVYVTKDGTKLIQDVITFDEIEKQKEAAKQDKSAAQEITKSDKPVVELFVMSYCPYGTQMEKGILPVVATLGTKINYNLRFVDYVMHGDKEITENLRQYCIEKTQPTKLSAYLGCFLKKGEGTSDTCLASAGIASAGIKACIAQVDAKFAVTKDAADKATWSNGQFPRFNVEKDLNAKYAVQGSPTLVINGVVAESGRDSASILKAICAAFTVAPKECETKLSDAPPAPGFGEGAANTNTAPDASCGN